MKLIDRISLHRVISMLLGFILTVIKLFTNKTETIDKPDPILKRRRKKDKDNA